MPKRPTVTLSKAPSKAPVKKASTTVPTGPLPGIFGEYAEFLKSMRPEAKPKVAEGKKRVVYKFKKGDKIKMKKGLYKGKEAIVKRRLIDGSVVVSFDAVQKDVVLTLKELEMNTTTKATPLLPPPKVSPKDTVVTPASYYKSLIDASLKK